jgi:hypothetical protein
VTPEQLHHLLYGFVLGSGPDFGERLVQLERGQFIREVSVYDLDQRVSVVPAEHDAAMIQGLGRASVIEIFARFIEILNLAA